MKKRVTPLRAGRGKARPKGGFSLLGTELAGNAYPFNKISPNLKVMVSDRAKRMTLRLDPAKRVVHLVIPKRACLRNAYYFAKDNSAWIEEKLKTLPRSVPFADGRIIPVLGRNREIVVLYNPSLKRTSIELKKDQILVLTNKRDISGRLRRFLIEKAREKITELAELKAAQIRRKITDIKVRDTKSRWGSCSDDGKLSFSWRLLFAPPAALDYVVAHEIAHLVHMDHADGFWKLCERLCKDYEAGKDWMREHGHELMRYGSPDEAE